MTGRLPVAMMGVGHVHAPGYLQYLLSRSDIELVGVYDADAATARSTADRLGIAVFRSEDECVERCRAVVVCSEPTRQLALVRKAADAGLPTLCEKPLGTTPAESRELVELSERILLSVAFPVRYHAAATRLRQTIREGLLGSTPSVWATNRNSFPGGWFADPELAGGGCLLDHVVHVADLLRWIWDTEFVNVSAEAGVLHRPGLTMEDTAIALVTCANGMIVTIDPSMSRPRGMPGALDLVMEVWGEHGKARLDIFADGIDMVDREGVLSHRHFDDAMSASMISAWIEAVLEGGPAPVPARDAFSATALAFAARKAADTHRVVDVGGC